MIDSMECCGYVSALQAFTEQHTLHGVCPQGAERRQRPLVLKYQHKAWKESGMRNKVPWRKKDFSFQIAFALVATASVLS